jgi:hypothetical protein
VWRGVHSASIEFLLGKLPREQSIHPKEYVAVGAGIFADADANACAGCRWGAYHLRLCRRHQAGAEMSIDRNYGENV